MFGKLEAELFDHVDDLDQVTSPPRFSLPLNAAADVMRSIKSSPKEVLATPIQLITSPEQPKRTTEFDDESFSLTHSKKKSVFKSPSSYVDRVASLRFS